jgi:hypothetical protein
MSLSIPCCHRRLASIPATRCGVVQRCGTLAPPAKPHSIVRRVRTLATFLLWFGLCPFVRLPCHASINHLPIFPLYVLPAGERSSRSFQLAAYHPVKLDFGQSKSNRLDSGLGKGVCAKSEVKVGKVVGPGSCT